VDDHSYYNLKILNHLEDAPHVTMRIAAAKLDVSVKLAHSLFKGLIRRGLVHATRRDGRSALYLLTPEGISEKVRLTYEFLHFSRQFFHEARRRSSEVCSHLTAHGVRHVAFLGCGDLAEISYLGVKEHGLQLTAVFDDNAVGDTFLDLVVESTDRLLPEETKNTKTRFERVLVTAYDPAHPVEHRYVPDGVTPDGRFVWVFDHQDMVAEVAGRVSRLAGEKDTTG